MRGDFNAFSPSMKQNYKVKNSNYSRVRLLSQYNCENDGHKEYRGHREDMEHNSEEGWP